MKFQQGNHLKPSCSIHECCLCAKGSMEENAQIHTATSTNNDRPSAMTSISGQEIINL